MFLGNIVSKLKIECDDLFNVTDDYNNIIEGLPTLIVGWKDVKEIFENKRKISILDKRIDNNLYWTFTKYERRIDYDKDIEFFIKYCIKLIENDIEYEYLNLLTNRYSRVKKLIKYLTSKNVSYIYIYKNSFIYIFSKNKIVGIDFNAIDFLKINRKKVYKILYSNNNKLFFSDDFLTKTTRLIIRQNKIIPYLYFLKHNDR